MLTCGLYGNITVRYNNNIAIQSRLLSNISNKLFVVARKDRNMDVKTFLHHAECRFWTQAVGKIIELQNLLFCLLVQCRDQDTFCFETAIHFEI